MNIDKLVLLGSVLACACHASPGAHAGSTTTDAGGGGASTASDSGPPAWLHVEPYTALGCTHVPVTPDCDGGWCRIPAGCFVMGSPTTEWGRGAANEAQRKVTLTHSFVIGQREVSTSQWSALGFPNPLASAKEYQSCFEDDCPLRNMTWYETLSFANALSKSEGYEQCFDLSGCTGSAGGAGITCPDLIKLTTPTVYDCKGYRLPTEAEWEYAARAGTLSAFYDGDIVSQPQIGVCAPDPNAEAIGWYCQNSGGKAHPGAQKWPNAWSLYDTAGNVTELVFDGLNDAELNPDPTWTNPSGTILDPYPGRSKVSCGGSFIMWSSNLRSADNVWSPPDGRLSDAGFRLVRSVD